MQVNDIVQKVTATLISILEGGNVGEWVRPWKTGFPSCAATGRPYSGLNVLTALFTAMERGYTQNLWATYKQWAALGAQVRKGERGVHMILAKTVVKTDRATGEEQVVRYFSSFVVFNVAQVDGYTVPAPAAPPTLEDVEAFVAKTGAKISWGGSQAFFSPQEDQIQMPPREDFSITGGVYSVLFHELVHWTGTVPRLKRDLTGRFGSAAYAMEELVAELGSAMLCAYFGVRSELRRDHAAYLGHWLSVLREQPQALLGVAAKASQAMEYLLAGAQTSVSEVDEAA